MHEEAPPHCGWCTRFHGCLVVDMVMNWGYCDVKVKSQPLSSEQIKHIEDEIKSGDYEIIYTLEKEGAIFMPSFEIAMECPKFWDYQWGADPTN